MSRFMTVPVPFSFPTRILLPLSAAVLLSLSSGAFAQTDAAAPQTAAERATEDARKKELADQAKAMRQEAETTFAATEAGCYGKFLVNRCIDQAKQLRLETIQRARALEAEARKIELGQRQRAAAEVLAAQPQTDTPAGAPQPAAGASIPAVPAPSPDADIVPSAEAERIRAERARATSEAAAGAQAARAARDAERATKRTQTEAEAAARAAAAERDRARYEERIRKYEEEQAAKKK